MLQPLDREALRVQFAKAPPVPHIMIDDFLIPDLAKEIAGLYPSFEDALDQGKTFTTVNERKKIQITDPKLFSPGLAKLNSFLASTDFLEDLSYITGIPRILADEQLVGGGMHITGPGGRLDVHVDFNYIKNRALHRRLNLLLYLTPDWKEEWGGQFQLWDKDVRNCEAEFSPKLNRCVLFETSDRSYHGVVPISAQAKVARNSFAAYYYTREAPSHWKGEEHSTLFVARPQERYKKYLAMPATKVTSGAIRGVNSLKRAVKSIIGK